MLTPLLAAAAMAVASGKASRPSSPLEAAPLITAAEVPHEALYDRIADDIRRMNAAGRGIFNEDVSAIVAPYFPPGTSFAETAALLKRQALKPLTPFLGRAPSADAMYVTTFDMTKTTFSTVFVAIYFTFETTAAGQQVLKRTAAFLRASDM